MPPTPGWGTGWLPLLTTPNTTTPPYSPDLNPIEGAWELARCLRLHNCYFPELGEAMDAVADLFGRWRVEQLFFEGLSKFDMRDCL